MEKNGTLPYLVKEAMQSVNKKGITEEHLWYAVRNAINPEGLIVTISEALRLSATETEQLLIQNGFGDLVAQYRRVQKDNSTPSEESGYTIPVSEGELSPFPALFSVEFSPSLSQSVQLSDSGLETISLITKNITEGMKNDPFACLYRGDIMDYYNLFMSTDAVIIDEFILKNFGPKGPAYIVNCGIGANEQFNHLVAHLNNLNPNRKAEWFVVDSPLKLSKLPKDSTIENTLFMEFSRSGKTEETVKTHEYTPRSAKRIVFANTGPLKKIAGRDKNLVLNFPDQVSGRFGRNTTPFLLAVMHAAGMDTLSFWKTIRESINAFDLSSPSCLPAQIAQFIYLYQQKNKINHIYFGSNDELTLFSADEFLQFWNEGVNKNGNDISMSRYFGLPRDSHLNIEGILANHKTKMGIFLLRDQSIIDPLPPLVSLKIDPINPQHEGLEFGEEEFILAEANYKRFSELMPAIKITLHGPFTLEHAAILGQLWADITFFYSRMLSVDPGSNPEVKAVRDGSEKLMAELAQRKRNKL